MFYRLLIVDDEEDIREGLADFIDWHALGFEVVARIGNGREAIEFIKKEEVDVVLTDIKMTFISGLELAKYIQENEPGINVVIITGYKNFDFARQAINYHVTHYLLKPTKLEEINHTFREIKEKLDLAREEEERLIKIDQHYHKLISFVQEKFFADLSIGALYSEEDIKRRFSLIGLSLDLENSRYCVFTISISDYERYIRGRKSGKKDGLYTVIRNILRSNDGQDISYFPVSMVKDAIKVLAVSAVYRDNDIFMDKLAEYFHGVKARVQSILGIGLQYKIDNIFEGLEELTAHRNSLPTADGDGSQDILTLIDEERLGRLLEEQKLFMSYLNAGNIEAVNEIFDEFMDLLKDASTTVVHSFIIELFSMICNKLKSYGIFFGPENHGLLNYDKILKMEKKDDLYKWCKVILNDVVEKVLTYRDNSEAKVIQKAKEFIHQNYDKHILLKDVSDTVFLSSAYFSRIFKKITGTNFIHFLVQVRMRKAMELLEHLEYKVYEVSSMVGYNSTKYFFKIFKQYTGFTPSGYRKKVLSEGSLGDEG